MKSEKNKNFWTKHKKKVYAAGTLAIAATIGYILFKNRNSLFSLVKTENINPNSFLMSKEKIIAEGVEVAETHIITDVSTKILNEGEPISVCRHIRNLGENRYPSSEKIMTAKTLGIELGENQTFVEKYYKNLNVA